MTKLSALGRSNVMVPRMGVGAMTWGDAPFALFNPAKQAYGSDQNGEEERAALEASLSAGASFFDTAAMYSAGASESRLGELTRGKDVIIGTKFPRGFTSKTDEMPMTLEASLARLGRTTVDLYQHHFPTRRVDIPRLMEMMADAVQAGRIRAVGVSNYSAEQMRLAHGLLARRGIPLASNQVQYSLLHRQPEANGVLDACRELGITLIAYQPLASGALTGKYLGAGRPRGLRRFMSYFRPKGQEALGSVVALLKRIGEQYGKSPAQVALRWLIENPLVLPIPGAKNGQQATENAAALSFSLTPEEVESLSRATLAWRGV